MKNVNINEWSYQRYAKFYGSTELKDDDFNNKIRIITELILNYGIRNLYDIAEQSGCTYEECILKICYLKNKRVIGDYYIDSAAGIISLCSADDIKLLKKYENLIYSQKMSLENMAKTLNMDINDVFEDLEYLDNKKLLNGVILNKIDFKITYYSIEKHLKEKNFVTLNCPNCGAINDIKWGSKTRCDYCDTIVEDKTMADSIAQIIQSA